MYNSLQFTWVGEKDLSKHTNAFWGGDPANTNLANTIAFQPRSRRPAAPLSWRTVCLRRKYLPQAYRANYQEGPMLRRRLGRYMGSSYPARNFGDQEEPATIWQ